MSNILFCVTGPSGSGKTSIMRNVMDNELLSFTTRPMREGEVDGKDYIFIDYMDYIQLVGKGELVEYTNYGGNYYGLSMEELHTKLKKDHAFFICDNNGFNQIKEKYDKVVSIFLYASFADCFNNMQDRGDNIEKIGKRLSTYHNELANKGQYDYVVKNVRGYRLCAETIVKHIILSEIYKDGENNEPSTLI
jgi:guanylate kinase